MLKIPVELIFSWIAVGVVSAFLARRQGKNPFIWFFVGAIFGIFGIFYLFYSPNRQAQKAKQQEEKTTPVKILSPQTGSFWYTLDSKNNQQGPMSFEALKRSWQEGEISEATYIWSEVFEEWKPLGELVQTDH